MKLTLFFTSLMLTTLSLIQPLYAAPNKIDGSDQLATVLKSDGFKTASDEIREYGVKHGREDFSINTVKMVLGESVSSVTFEVYASYSADGVEKSLVHLASIKATLKKSSEAAKWTIDGVYPTMIYIEPAEK